MEHAYKSHTIVITTWASLDRNGYTPEVRVSKKAPIVLQTLKLNNAFPTKEEAENFALEAAKSGLTTRTQDPHKELPKAPLMQNQKRLWAKRWVHCNLQPTLAITTFTA